MNKANLNFVIKHLKYVPGNELTRHCMPTQRQAEETGEGEAGKNQWYLLSMGPPD